MKSALVSLVAASLVLAASGARAQQSPFLPPAAAPPATAASAAPTAAPPPVSPSPPLVDQWYGWQVLASDLLTAGSTAAFIQAVFGALGAGAGGLAASIVDAAVLSWEKVPDLDAAEPLPPLPLPRQAFTVSPTLMLTKDHSALGLVGTF